MKQVYLKCLLFVILSLTGIKATAANTIAYDCEVDGIYYILNKLENTASVTYYSSSVGNYNSIYYSYYKDNVIIPKNISYRGIEYSVTSIRDHAFFKCKGLTSIDIPNSVTSIGRNAFYGCNNLLSIKLSSSVTNIEYGTFYDCSSLTSIEIPNGVTSIDYDAFYGCSNLSSIEIPNSVTSIGYYAFYGCSSLSSIEIPNSVISIDFSAFSNCYSLKNVIIEDGEEDLSFVNNDAQYFENCPIETLYIGRNIGYSPFSNMTTLTSVTIGNNVKSIGASAFSGCSSLPSIIIPNSVTVIGSDAFKNCSSLNSVTIGNNVASIFDNAFSGCSSLPFIVIPNSVTAIGYGVFQNCSNLNTVTIGNSVASIGNYAFYGCSSLTSIELPNRVTNISGYAFANCSSLTSIDFPNRLTSIGKNAFQNCSDLTSLSIPISVTSIGNGAFYGCTKLESVYSEITNVFSIDAFEEGCDAVLYVPYGKKLTYIQTDGWNVFKDIIEMDPAIMNTSLLLSCNSKGSITINGTNVFTNKIGSVDILEDAENTIVFTPKANCKLEQVCFNGFDVTTSVENNTLKAVIPAKSQMVVTFANESGDMNNDGKIDISDVVLLVNMILGQ